MQDTTDLIIKAINYQYPEQIPIILGFLPAAMKQNGREIRKIAAGYPDLLGDKWLEYDPEKDMPASYRYGGFTDAWGCVWSNEQEGMEAYVTGHPLKKREDIRSFETPKIDDGLHHGFMYLRILDLRGFEEAMLDFAEECEEIQILIDKVCEYNVRQMKLICQKHKSELIFTGDDLGMQRGIAIGAAKWRKYFKPAFKKIYDVCHGYGKYVFMHTDGDIIEIMPDLVDTGVDIINPQYRANGIDRLVETCKGRIPIMLDLDRQLFPHASPSELREHIRETVERMYMPQGGFGINVEIGMEVPMENIEAIIDEIDKIRLYKGKT